MRNSVSTVSSETPSILATAAPNEDDFCADSTDSRTLRGIDSATPDAASLALHRRGEPEEIKKERMGHSSTKLNDPERTV
jgi:hypothetical protein